MSSVPVATVEILNDLLDAELNSVFRFMGEGSPYLNGATAAVRKPLAEMVDASTRRAHELYDLIEGLGGSPVPRGLRSEEQYLAFLSLKFMLPKLVHEKQLAIRRWQSALSGIRTVPEAPREAVQLLEAQLAELNRELASLEQATAHVTPAQSH